MQTLSLQETRLVGRPGLGKVVEGVRCDVRCGVWCGGDCIWCGRKALCLPTTYMNWTGPDVIGPVLMGKYVPHANQLVASTFVAVIVDLP